MQRRLALMLSMLLCAVTVCGCNSPLSLILGYAPDWDATDYSIDEIRSLALAQNANLDHITDDDCTREALHAYNNMLGYVENVLDIEYKVYDFYHVNFDSVKSYVIKIVTEDDIAETEASDHPLGREIMLCCEESGRGVQSGVVPYLMARQWEDDLFGAINDLHPDYLCETDYIGLDHIVPAVTADLYDDIRDYTYYLNEKSYHDGMKVYDAVIRITLPADTGAEAADLIFAELLPILQKYCVTIAEFRCGERDEAAAWRKSYPVRANTSIPES